MDRIKTFSKKIGRGILFVTIMIEMAAITLYTIAQADDTSSTSSSSSSTDSAEKQLTTEEIDKIVEDLKVSGNIDNILDKLDEIIERAKLSGNSALQEYASNMKTAYELQKQLDSVKSLISASKKKNTSIATVDAQVQKIISVTTIVQDLKGAVSDEALLVLESLSDDNVKNLQELFAEIESLVDLTDVSSLSVQQRSLLDVLVLSKIIDDSMVKDERLQTAKDALEVAVTILKSYEKEKYGTDEYNALNSGSDEFSKTAKKASFTAPEQVIFFDGYFTMKYPPIMYDSHILIALEDLYQYIDASIEYMYNNATMVIQSPNKILEIVGGKNIGYINDIPSNMPVPVLNFKNKIYMSGEFFAQAYGISYKYLADQECLIFYKNLNQLSNSSVPNQLEKD